MSHYMENSEYFFSKFIFLGLNQNQISLLKAYKSELKEETDKRYWVFLKDLKEINYHITPDSLVIIEEANCNELLVSGHPLVIIWSLFIKNFYSLNNLSRINSTRKVCLSFLPEFFQRLLSTVFHLYGYQTIKANEPDSLLKELENGLHYLIFDVDMNGLDRKNRYGIMQRVQGLCKEGMQASVVKNFDTGSLFNDIISPVKEISNLILSPEEYFLFLRKFLYIKETEALDKQYLLDPDVMRFISENERYGKVLKSGFSIFNDLKDSKKIYNKVQHLKEDLFNDKRSEAYHMAHLRFKITDQPAEILLKKTMQSQRELFTFFSNSVENNTNLV